MYPCVCRCPTLIDMPHTSVHIYTVNPVVHRFCICEFTCSPKLICNPKLTLTVRSWAFVHTLRVERNVSPVCTFPAEVKQTGLCFLFHVTLSASALSVAYLVSTCFSHFMLLETAPSMLLGYCLGLLRAGRLGCAAGRRCTCGMSLIRARVTGLSLRVQC